MDELQKWDDAIVKMLIRPCNRRWGRLHQCWMD